MKKSEGFTLIELLVVVLIIGILSAIAVPQYQKTVERARASEAVINVRAIAEAEKRHILLTDTLTTSLNDLDIDISQDKYSYNILPDVVNYIIAVPKNGRSYLIIYFLNWPDYPVYSNKLTCRVAKTAPEKDKDI